MTIPRGYIPGKTDFPVITSASGTVSFDDDNLETSGDITVYNQDKTEGIQITSAEISPLGLNQDMNILANGTGQLIGHGNGVKLYTNSGLQSLDVIGATTNNSQIRIYNISGTASGRIIASDMSFRLLNGIGSQYMDMPNAGGYNFVTSNDENIQFSPNGTGNSSFTNGDIELADSAPEIRTTSTNANLLIDTSQSGTGDLIHKSSGSHIFQEGSGVPILTLTSGGSLFGPGNWTASGILKSYSQIRSEGTFTVGGITVIDTDRSFVPPQIADSAASNNRIYYSTDVGKLVYKDSSGTVNPLY